MMIMVLWLDFSRKFLHIAVKKIAVLFGSQSPTARRENDIKKKKKKIKLCHHWIGKTWRDEADMKVGLFHGQAAGPPRP